MDVISISWECGGTFPKTIIKRPFLDVYEAIEDMTDRNIDQTPVIFVNLCFCRISFIHEYNEREQIFNMPF